jgi:hypothetical protein
MVFKKRLSGVLAGIVILLLSAVVSSGGVLSKQKDNIRKLTIDDTAWQELMEEPASHFLQAKESLRKGNKKEAARNIRKGVNIINVEITRAARGMKPKLSNVAGELLNFVEDLNKNKEIVTGSLERAFLRTESILVEHKLAKTDIYINEKSYKSAAYALEAACRHLHYSQLWNPRKLPDEYIETIKEIQENLLLLVDGQNWDLKQIISARNKLKQILDEI